MKILLIIPVIVGLLMIPIFADAQALRTHSVSASEEFFSVDIPIVGTISAKMKYDLDFEIIKPNKIQSGKSDYVSLSPKRGTLTTSFYLNGNYQESIVKDIPLGSSTTMPIPGTIVGQIFAKPTLVVAPQVSGPGSTTITKYVEINSMATERFLINVNNQIVNSDSITVSFPMGVILNYGEENQLVRD